MVKIRVTEKEMKEGFKNIITIGYCEAQNLLRYINPSFYTCGVYGWKSDIYVINNSTIISTGYGPIDKIRNWKLVEEYEKKAYIINHNYKLSYEQQKTKVNKLLNEFINKIIGDV